MDCKKFNEMMTMYMDEALNQKENALFEEHLNNCENCRKELEEMMLPLSVCKDISDEELPVDFKENLHKKLMEVKLQVGSQSNERNILKKFNKNRFVAMISSVAALIMVTVFLWGIVGHLNIGGKKSALMESASTAEAPKMEMKKEEPKVGERKADQAEASSVTTNSEPAARENSAYMDGAAENKEKMVIEAQKPTAVLKKDIADNSQSFTAADTGLQNKMILNRNTSMEIFTEKPDTDSEKLKEIVAANSGEITASPELFQEVKAKSTSDTTAISFNIRIPNGNFTQFEQSVKNKFSDKTVQFDVIKVDDVSSKVNELNSTLQTANTEMQNKSTEKSESNSADLDALRNKIDVTQKELESLVKDAEYTLVRVTIKKK